MADQALPPAGSDRAENNSSTTQLLERAVILLLFVLLASFRATTAGAQTLQFLNAAPCVYANGTNVAVIVNDSFGRPCHSLIAQVQSPASPPMNPTQGP